MGMTTYLPVITQNACLAGLGQNKFVFGLKPSGERGPFVGNADFVKHLAQSLIFWWFFLLEGLLVLVSRCHYTDHYYMSSGTVHHYALFFMLIIFLFRVCPYWSEIDNSLSLLRHTSQFTNIVIVMYRTQNITLI